MSLVVRLGCNDGRAGETHRTLDGDPEHSCLGSGGEGEGEGVAEGDDEPSPAAEQTSSSPCHVVWC